MGDIVGGSAIEVDSYSNCRAAMFDGNPLTMQVISHGCRWWRAVLAAPPRETPLCWARRRGGFGVDPIYKAVCRIMDRKR